MRDGVKGWGESTWGFAMEEGFGREDGGLARGEGR